MKKIWLIIQREYLTRVKKKSFIIMTFLGPILMASVWIVPLLLASRSEGVKTIEVLDETGLFYEEFKETNDTKFVYITDDLQTAKENLAGSESFGILYIPKSSYAIPKAFYLYSYKKPGLNLKMYLQESANKILENKKLMDEYGIDEETLSSVKSNISLVVEDIETSKKSYTEISWALGFIGGMLIYFFIFMYGAQVMRGVIEEKTNRIVEVIVSSVKPIQLMMGKIVGIALVGLTQFLIWIFLTAGIVTVLKTTILPKAGIAEMSQTIPQNVMSNGQQAAQVNQSTNASPQLTEFSRLFDSAMSQPWGLIIFCFVFYFITGYLLYASVFAAIGSAVDNETETQQFMLPVTIPIILALMVAIGTMQNPESSLSFWCSMIPLTSPIVMMARIPFGVPIWEIAVSMILMLAAFLGFVWMAAKVYRTGILMYGKKTSWKEMWKWLRYSG